ncbi:Histone-lysine N-methyltransferase SETMAR [Eumeta japonica]|uniref:Histone-lysine N-methyltransferase SETMAR n=1 Tax=Eumeta variegata TaxID=151549 RepID=A0A4C1VEN8_EUMVA|nr:Histone-lysine N-methyltransferase SETMAR [Eumeta japonica]
MSELAAGFGVSDKTILIHLKRYGKVRKIEKRVPHELSERTNRHASSAGPLLVQDNARTHTSQQTVAKLEELRLECLRHPPFSPDLAPTDYHFFRNLDNFLQGKKSDSNGAVQTAFKAKFLTTEPAPRFFAPAYVLRNIGEDVNFDEQKKNASGRDGIECTASAAPTMSVPNNETHIGVTSRSRVRSNASAGRGRTQLRYVDLPRSRRTCRANSHVSKRAGDAVVGRFRDLFITHIAVTRQWHLHAVQTASDEVVKACRSVRPRTRTIHNGFLSILVNTRSFLRSVEKENRIGVNLVFDQNSSSDVRQMGATRESVRPTLLRQRQKREGKRVRGAKERVLL